LAVVRRWLCPSGFVHFEKSRSPQDFVKTETPTKKKQPTKIESTLEKECLKNKSHRADNPEKNGKITKKKLKLIS